MRVIEFVECTGRSWPDGGERSERLCGLLNLLNVQVVLGLTEEKDQRGYAGY